MPDREGWGKGGGGSDGEGGAWALCVHEEAGKTAAVHTKSHPALDKPLELHGELGEVSETTTREPKNNNNKTYKGVGCKGQISRVMGMNADQSSLLTNDRTWTS